MKILWTILLLSLPIISNGQNSKYLVENKIFIGAEVGLYNYTHIRVDIEQHLLDGKYLLQLGYATDLFEHLLQLKLGFRIFRLKKSNIRFYVYLPPYLNYNFQQRKYNTPFGFELMKDFNLSKHHTLYCGINTDIFKDKIVPQIRFRIKLFSWKEK